MHILVFACIELATAPRGGEASAGAGTDNDHGTQHVERGETSVEFAHVLSFPFPTESGFGPVVASPDSGFRQCVSQGLWALVLGLVNSASPP